MGGKYIDEQPESQVEKKTATQILEDENLEEHITDSMRSSHKMYAEVDDEDEFVHTFSFRGAFVNLIPTQNSKLKLPPNAKHMKRSPLIAPKPQNSNKKPPSPPLGTRMSTKPALQTKNYTPTFNPNLIQMTKNTGASK